MDDVITSLRILAGILLVIAGISLAVLVFYKKHFPFSYAKHLPNHLQAIQDVPIEGHADTAQVSSTAEQKEIQTKEMEKKKIIKRKIDANEILRKPLPASLLPYTPQPPRKPAGEIQPSDILDRPIITKKQPTARQAHQESELLQQLQVEAESLHKKALADDEARKQQLKSEAESKSNQRKKFEEQLRALESQQQSAEKDTKTTGFGAAGGSPFGSTPAWGGSSSSATKVGEVPSAGSLPKSSGSFGSLSFNQK